MKLRWLFISCLLVAVNAAATEIVYQPINPSFGGNPMNGSFLLQKAQSQNAHSAPDADRSFVDRFREALERNIINSLTRRIADGEIVEGLYDTGEYTVEVVGQPDGSVVVYITHNGSGEQTVITMPSI
ncbi:curli production assembly/transport component CsgF [Idiomarina loihiensis]|uniref:curli assembly protein CsgF n=2 Tax=Idiomarinaceae TaxID=267893 RepID=UPI000D70C9EE|nr:MULTISPECIES: curli assembly protein CsgF [Idiomarina]PWW40426.1 curli production assembly/transport component CsgF [Idiomarina loihiensis]TDP50117.1 curli production assembly/transport component CsgF [Idiomarina loihiensis]TDS24531.1 curli production assembly/transport component CsgF [Idiomarina sp. H2]|tara:strand:- start:37542 stop:37925 length:384 start_codon:yes stop_codon:yes gene_type:complete